MSINMESAFFTSSDHKNEVGYSIWSESKIKPKAILQLSHGMAEHIDRYDDFARYMTSGGYVVIGNNHIGHGNTASSSDEISHIEGKNGYKNIVDDMHRLTQIANEKYPEIPVILFGHSMGSLLSRFYAGIWGNDISALILCGTSGSNPLGRAGIAMTGLISTVKGSRHRSKFVENMAFGSYNDHYENVKTGYEWLSVNEDNVKAYVNDDKCGVLFTLSGFRNLFSLLLEVSGKNCIQKIPKDLPVLLISGAEDPVGNYGKGVAEVADRLRSAGIREIDVEIYEGMRHEILNETGKLKVYCDLLKWCDKTIKG